MFLGLVRTINDMKGKKEIADIQNAVFSIMLVAKRLNPEILLDRRILSIFQDNWNYEEVTARWERMNGGAI